MFENTIGYLSNLRKCCVFLNVLEKLVKCAHLGSSLCELILSKWWLIIKYLFIIISINLSLSMFYMDKII